MTSRAVIIGAGIGGLSTAAGLQRAGWEVTVLERWPRIVGMGAALGVWAQAQEALAGLGLADDFARDSVPVAGAAIYRRDGRVLLRLPDDSPRMPHVRLIGRRRLMEHLVALADGVDIRTGAIAATDGLRAARDGADVLIGADGLRSTVRETFFGTRTAPRYSGLIGWRGVVDFESGDYGETWDDRSGTGALFGNTPMEPGRTNFYASVRTHADDRGGLPALRERFAGWREPIPAILASAQEADLLRNPIHDLHPPLRTFVDGTVALLGDAAHAMTPHAGRGACEAILDARSLVTNLTSGAEVPAALHAYDRARRRPAQRVAARSWRMGRVAQSAGASAFARDAVARAAGTVFR